jgi:hypothetical protein
MRDDRVDAGLNALWIQGLLCSRFCLRFSCLDQLRWALKSLIVGLDVALKGPFPLVGESKLSRESKMSPPNKILNNLKP